MKFPHAGMGRSIVDVVKGFGRWSNMTNFIYGGAKVNDWLKCMRDWRADHALLLQQDPTNGSWQFPPEFMVIVLDDANTLQPGGYNAQYAGLTPAVLDLYNEFFAELRYFSNVAYGYSDCPGTFRMSAQLAPDMVRLGAMAVTNGHHAFSLAKFWEQTEPFCVTEKGNPSSMDWWHRGERGEKKLLEACWHQLFVKVVYFLAAVNYRNWRPMWQWIQTANIPPPPGPPDTPPPPEVGAPAPATVEPLATPAAVP